MLSLRERKACTVLDIVKKYRQNWALAVNLKKTIVMNFQKDPPRCQESKKHFTINNHVIEHSMSYTYLGITITASGSFNMAVNALKQKAQRALHTIKRKYYVRKPIWKIGRKKLKAEVD